MTKTEGDYSTYSDKELLIFVASLEKWAPTPGGSQLYRDYITELKQRGLR